MRSRHKRRLTELRRELADDDTTGRTEPETVDVWADQAPIRDWLDEDYSDEELDVRVRVRLGPRPA